MQEVDPTSDVAVQPPEVDKLALIFKNICCIYFHDKDR